MSKIRKKIPKTIKTDVLFSADRTCCICHVRGKAVQIHHIDENPGHNTFENLAVLCHECHDKAHIEGGFGQKLDAQLVIRYRDAWLKDVEHRRNLANEKAVEKEVSEFNTSQQAEAKLQSHSVEQIKLKKPSIAYINSLPAFKSVLQQQVQPRRDTGIRSEMIQASYDYIDALTGILVTLANYYSLEQFGNQSPQDFFSEMIASRFRWHYAIAEPHGPTTGGKIVHVLCAGSVALDVEKMIEDMVGALILWDDDFDLKDWKNRWHDN